MRRNRPALFNERHFETEIIVLCVRVIVVLVNAETAEIMGVAPTSQIARFNVGVARDVPRRIVITAENTSRSPA